jgi:hypothetical protein
MWPLNNRPDTVDTKLNLVFPRSQGNRQQGRVLQIFFQERVLVRCRMCQRETSTKQVDQGG